MLNISIDGIPLAVEEGTLILEAALKLGLKVPTFCYHPNLQPVAACRLCLVEIKGLPRLQPACATAMSEGMEVLTESTAVQDARKGVLELLLVNHPLDCPVCDKGGECELQDMVFAYGRGDGRFDEQKRRFHSQDQPLNAVIIANLNRCIQCQRCVRVCDDVVGAEALGAIGRGSDTHDTGFMESLAGCDHCGNCVEVCPVGALMNRPYRYQARPWDLTEVDSVCPHCGTGCQLTAGVRDGKLMRVRSKQSVGINQDSLCARGRFGLDIALSEARIERPMVRRGEHLEAVSWEEALDFIRQRWPRIHQDRTAGGLASARLSNETLYGFQKLMRSVFQSNSIDSVCRWGRPPETSGLPPENSGPSPDRTTEPIPPLVRLLSHMSRKPLVDLLKDAKTLVVIGTNVTDENPVSDYLIRQAHASEDFELFMLSCRPSRLDKLAKAAARYLPGEEPTLLAALMQRLMQGSIQSAMQREQGQVGHSMTGISANYKPPIPLTVLDQQAASAQQHWLESLGQAVEGSGPITLILGMDLLRSPYVAATLQGLHELLALLRTQNRAVDLQFLFDQCNQLGAWDFGVLPNRLPGYRPIADQDSRRLFEAAWQTTLPTEPGYDFTGMLQACQRHEMGLLYIVGEDPLLSCPDKGRVSKALAEVDLLIVQDAFLTATANLADVVLPGITFAETDGTLCNNEGRVQRLRPLGPPQFHAKPDLWIFNRVAAALEHDLGTDSPPALFAEMTQLVPAYAAISFEGLGLEGNMTRATREAIDHEAVAPLPSTVAAAGSGAAGLASASFGATGAAAADAGNSDRFYLITGNSLFHSGYISERSPTLRTILSGPYIELSRQDGQTLGVTDGEHVRVSGNDHEVILPAKINPGLPRRVVFIPDNFKQIELNRWLAADQYPSPIQVEKWLIDTVPLR